MTQPSTTSLRSHYCGEVDQNLAGQQVTLCGWVSNVRKMFIILRDHTAVVQVTVDPDDAAMLEQCNALRNEYCIQVTGQVALRPESQIKADETTGHVEVHVNSITVLNEAPALPFVLKEDANEEIRLRYRYLDLRRDPMQEAIRLRARLTRSLRAYLDGQQFLDIETPILTKATPEGARDYLVPSRVHPGSFYALPQSPQLFKQLLMMSGMDRYYQFARCFRDEDLRADRQPEFTQLDIEMAFIERSDIQRLAENMIRHAFADVMNVQLPDPFPRMTWHEAMTRFGSDKPDLRIDFELITVCDAIRHVDFKVFSEPANDPACRVAALCVPGGASLSRKQIDEYTEFVKKHGARGLAWIKVNDASAGLGGLQSPIAKFLDETAADKLIELTAARDGDLLLFGAGEKPTVANFLGELRLRVAADLGLVNEGWKPLWVTDFPMFEWDEGSDRWYACNHPFTAPVDEDLDTLESAPGEAISKGYDMVLNGWEIGGGSIRIHDRALQSRIFRILGIDETEASEKFGFLLEALRYGCPPHGGIAFGLDRMATLMSGSTSIRDVIAFPKTTSASCLMTQAPSTVSEDQLNDLHVRTLPAKD